MQGNFLYSQSIIYTGNTYKISSGDVIDACKGYTDLDTVLQELIEYLNTIGEVCQVKVSSTDGTCDYLFNKLTSTTSTVSITKGSTVVNNKIYETIDLNVASYKSVLFSDSIDRIPTVTGNIYTSPQGTLINDGDEILIEGFISYGASPTAVVNLVIDTLTINLLTLTGLLTTGNGVQFKSKVIRNANNSCRVETSINTMKRIPPNAIALSRIIISDFTPSVNLDSNNIPINVNVASITATPLTSKFFTIKKFTV